MLIPAPSVAGRREIFRLPLIITSEEVARGAELVAHTLLREPYFIVAPKGMAARRLDLEALGRQLPLVRYSARAFLGREVDAWLQHRDLALPHQYELDTSDAVLALVKAGLTPRR